MTARRAGPWGCRRDMGNAATLLAGLLLALVPLPASPQENPIMLVYLPGAPIESMSKLAEAVTELGSYVRTRVPDLSFDVRAFRRAQDAAPFLETAGRDVALIVTDPAFLLDLPADFEVVPRYRFVRSGRETHRKLVVVKVENEGFGRLADLRGRSISVAQGEGKGSSLFLSRVVFGGEVVAETWFGEIYREADDFSATANVLFDRTDSALVSEDNPLLSSHLGKDLREVYASPPVSLPVVAVRTSAVSDAQRAALDKAMLELESRAEGKKILAGLKIDGIRLVEEGDGPLDRAGLLRLPSEKRRALQIATLPLPALDLNPLPALKPEQVPFTLGVELVDLPVSFEILLGKQEKIKSWQP